MVAFRYERVTDRITRIFGLEGEMWYLVTGRQRAALLDTGTGIGHMLPLIRQLTELPLIILLTHGHIDHAMGAAEFDCPIYMDSRDDPIYEAQKEIGLRWESLEKIDPTVAGRVTA